MKNRPKVGRVVGSLKAFAPSIRFEGFRYFRDKQYQEAEELRQQIVEAPTDEEIERH